MIYEKLNRSICINLMSNFPALVPVTNRYESAFHPIRTANSNSAALINIISTIAKFVFTLGTYHLYIRNAANKEWNAVVCQTINTNVREKTQFNERIQGLDGTLRTSRARVSELDQQLQNELGRNELLEGIKRRLTQLNLELDRDKASLTQNKNELETRLQETESELKKCENWISGAFPEWQEANSKVDCLEGIVKQKDQEIQQLTQKVKELMERLGDAPLNEPVQPILGSN